MAKTPDYPKQDREAGLPVTHLEGGRRVTRYDPALALQIIEQLAEGRTLKKICQAGSGFPAHTTFLRWVARVPELRQAYLAARAMSALSMEEEAIDAMRTLAQAPGSSQKIRATEGMVNQLRWSAARRDPQTYGERNQTNVVVPININTTLDLGDAGAKSAVELPDIYSYDLKARPSGEELGLKVEDLGSEETAMGHKPPKQAGPPKMTPERARKLADAGKISPFAKVLQEMTPEETINEPV